MTLVDDIKASIDIVDLVSETVQLRRAGRTFKAPCPFHTERTPSFVVDPTRQSWHCFGACSEGGDIFSWIMKTEGVEFREALRTLADRAGLRLTPMDARAEERAKQLDRLRNVNEATATFYRHQLQQAPEAESARAYVAQRGLDPEIIEAFDVGYAPEQSDALTGHLRARGFTTEELIAAGVAIETTNGPIDRFRSRMMFPIRDPQGRCVGFGGRALDGADAKYLNTAQTELFDKSGLLYGLERAREAMRKEDQIIIVEGYMDVIAAHQHGQRAVVASMGTSLTEKQVALIRPLTRNILLALDADAAGMAATQRGIETTRKAVGTEKVPVLDARGLVRMQDQLAADIRIIALPAGQDPDDLIRREPEQWALLVREAPGYLDYRFGAAKQSHNMEDARARAGLLEDLAPLVAAISDPVVRAEYVDRLAVLVRIDPATLRARLSRAGNSPNRSLQPERAVLARRHNPQTEFLLKLLCNRPEIVADLIPADLPPLIDDSIARELLQARLAAVDNAAWTELLSEEMQEELARVRQAASTLQPLSVADAHKAAQQAIDFLRKRHARDVLLLERQTIAEYERQYQRDPLTRAAVALKHGSPEATPEAGDPTIQTAARSLIDHHAKAIALHRRATSEPEEETTS